VAHYVELTGVEFFIDCDRESECGRVREGNIYENEKGKSVIVGN
jgi:hypothetical protein